MKKTRVLVLCLTLTTLLAACGDRDSGFSPAENAVTANPEDTIALRARNYELPPATPAPDGPTASYDTGDSSGGRTLTLDTLNPALEQTAAGTADEVAGAVAENALEDGRSTTIADETSEGDAAEATGGDLNVVTDPTARPADAVVDPATGGEVELENTVEETSVGEAAVEPDAVELDAVEPDAVEPNTNEVTGEASDDTLEGDTTTDPTEDETLTEQADPSTREAPVAEANTETAVETEDATGAETETETVEIEAAVETGAETGGAIVLETAPATEAALAETGGAVEETAEGSSPAETSAVETGAAETTPAEASPALLAQAAGFDWEQLGETAYANCSACHQQNGQGIVGAFPPLAGHINELYNVDGGRKYIINVVLYGLQGEIEVLGQPYNGLMAAWSQLSDEEIAATLNHELTSWGNDALLEDFVPIVPDEVAAERAEKLTAAQVLELRPELP